MPHNLTNCWVKADAISRPWNTIARKTYQWVHFRNKTKNNLEAHLDSDGVWLRWMWKVRPKTEPSCCSRHRGSYAEKHWWGVLLYRVEKVVLCGSTQQENVQTQVEDRWMRTRLKFAFETAAVSFILRNWTVIMTSSWQKQRTRSLAEVRADNRDFLVNWFLVSEHVE